MQGVWRYPENIFIQRYILFPAVPKSYFAVVLGLNIFTAAFGPGRACMYMSTFDSRLPVGRRDSQADVSAQRQQTCTYACQVNSALYEHNRTSLYAHVGCPHSLADRLGHFSSTPSLPRLDGHIEVEMRPSNDDS